MSLMSAPATGPKCHQCERQFDKSYGCKWWGWVGCQGDFTRVKRQWLGCDLLCRFTDELHTAWPWLPPGIVLSKRRSITTPTPSILPKHHGRENCTAMKSVDRSKTCLEQPMDLNEKSGKGNFNLFKLCGDQCKAMCISLMVDKCSSAIIVWTVQPWAQSLINSWKSGTPPGKQEKMWPTRRWRESTDSVTGRITPGSITLLWNTTQQKTYGDTDVLTRLKTSSRLGYSTSPYILCKSIALSAAVECSSPFTPPLWVHQPTWPTAA